MTSATDTDTDPITELAEANATYADALRIVAEWCVETANTDADADPHDLAVDLMFRLEQAGHTLPEVTA